MTTYLLPFMVDPQSLLLGIGLGVAAGIAVMIIIKNL